MFQSPSLRGSGRFPARRDADPARTAGRFNPLHCGAVVASKRRKRGRSRKRPLFQSPSLRGSGRFCPSPHGGWARRTTFQSPSLRGSGRFEPTLVNALRRARFNPLHCGAVVASRTRRRRRQRRRRRFNPLHCGAVVASTGSRLGRKPERARFNPLHCGAVVASWRWRRCSPPRPPVSIPFIAGQWSLRERAQARAKKEIEFQSPSLRGSGRFEQIFVIGDGGFDMFQSPSLRGSGRFSSG